MNKLLFYNIAIFFLTILIVVFNWAIHAPLVVVICVIVGVVIIKGFLN